MASGAHLVNDISGGTLDADMLPAVADLRVPYILSHMRGALPASRLRKDGGRGPTDVEQPSPLQKNCFGRFVGGHRADTGAQDFQDGKF